jgi:signal transduction histidine kinase
LDAYFNVDPQRVRQIFVNLLSNAVQVYSSMAVVFQLVIERTGIEGNIVHEKIKVMDTGMGISKDFLQTSCLPPYAREH